MFTTDVTSANVSPVVGLPPPGSVCGWNAVLWLLTALHLERVLGAFWGWVPSA